MRRLSILLLIGLMTFSFSLKKPTVHYSAHSRGFNFSLNLCTDSTFSLSSAGCTYIYSAKGSWLIDNDTLYLKYKKIKEKIGSNERRLKAYSKFWVYNQDSIYTTGEGEMALYAGRLMTLSTTK